MGLPRNTRGDGLRDAMTVSAAGTSLLAADGTDQMDADGRDRISNGADDSCCCVGGEITLPPPTCTTYCGLCISTDSLFEFTFALDAAPGTWDPILVTLYEMFRTSHIIMPWYVDVGSGSASWSSGVSSSTPTVGHEGYYETTNFTRTTACVDGVLSLVISVSYSYPVFNGSGDYLGTAGGMGTYTVALPSSPLKLSSLGPISISGTFVYRWGDASRGLDSGVVTETVGGTVDYKITGDRCCKDATTGLCGPGTPDPVANDSTCYEEGI